MEEHIEILECERKTSNSIADEMGGNSRTVIGFPYDKCSFCGH